MRNILLSPIRSKDEIKLASAASAAFLYTERYSSRFAFAQSSSVWFLSSRFSNSSFSCCSLLSVIGRWFFSRKRSDAILFSFTCRPVLASLSLLVKTSSLICSRLTVVLYSSFMKIRFSVSSFFISSGSSFFFFASASFTFTPFPKLVIFRLSSILSRYSFTRGSSVLLILDSRSSLLRASKSLPASRA